MIHYSRYFLLAFLLFAVCNPGLGINVKVCEGDRGDGFLLCRLPKSNCSSILKDYVCKGDRKCCLVRDISELRPGLNLKKPVSHYQI